MLDDPLWTKDEREPVTQRTPQPEMPAEHAILGLLLLDDGAGHGYDLARHFSDGQPLATVLHLEAGMLYHHLKKLARAGWVTSTVEPQGSRPPRQIYRITPDGRAELHRWLSEPVMKTREIRLEFLVKLYFAWRFDQELATRLVAEQQETLRGLAASLTDQLAQIDAGAGARAAHAQDTAFLHQVLSLRLSQTRAAIDWLDQVDGAAVTAAMDTPE